MLAGRTEGTLDRILEKMALELPGLVPGWSIPVPAPSLVFGLCGSFLPGTTLLPTHRVQGYPRGPGRPGPWLGPGQGLPHFPV